MALEKGLMYFTTLALLWLALAPMTTAQDVQVETGQSNPGPTELCTVEGVVSSAKSGEPLRKIVVTIQGAENPRLLNADTDPTGHFILKGVEAGRYRLTAQGNGYPSQAYGQRRPFGSGTLVILKPGDHLQEINFQLQPGGVITGAVSDEDGDPMAGAVIMALRTIYANGQRQLTPFLSAQTNDLGQYRLFGLIPDQYYVAVNPASVPLASGKEAEGEVYVPTYYPGTNDPAQAIPVQVQPGGEVPGIDLSLKPVRGFRVRGLVLSAVGGRVPEGLGVLLLPREAGSVAYAMRNYNGTVRDAEGSFEIHGVPAGSYFLDADWNNGRKSYYGRIEVEVESADVDGIILSLGPGADLSGRVRLDPEPHLDFTKLRVVLQASERTMMRGGNFAQVRPDGRSISPVSEPHTLSGFVQMAYAELRRMAERHFKSEQPGRTLQATALVHEAWIRLFKTGPAKYVNRAHFFGVAARAMRHILVEEARRRRARKRGGGWERIPLEKVQLPHPETPDYLAIDSALTRLTRFDRRLAQIIELRIFTGLTARETARMLRMGESTVRNRRSVAEAWLRREIETQSHQAGV